MEWIEVNKMLPQITLAQRFLILKAGYYHEVAVFSPDGKGGGYWYRGREEMLEVTHWMPLPDAPSQLDQSNTPKGTILNGKYYMENALVYVCSECHCFADIPGTIVHDKKCSQYPGGPKV